MKYSAHWGPAVWAKSIGPAIRASTGPSPSRCCSRITANAELRQRQEREARAVSILAHPHICALYDIGREDDISTW